MIIYILNSNCCSELGFARFHVPNGMSRNFSCSKQLDWIAKFRSNKRTGKPFRTIPTEQLNLTTTIGGGTYD